MGITVPDYTESGSGHYWQEGCGEVAGMVSVLAERARSEGARSTRAVETTPAASQGEYWGLVCVSASRNSSHSLGLSSMKRMEGCGII